MADYPNAPQSTKVNNVENAVGGNDDDPLCMTENVALLAAPKQAAFSIRQLCLLCRFWQIHYHSKEQSNPIFEDYCLD